MTRAAKVIQAKFRNYCHKKHCNGEVSNRAGERVNQNGRDGSLHSPGIGVPSKDDSEFFMFGARTFFHGASREGTPTSLKCVEKRFFTWLETAMMFFWL